MAIIAVIVIIFLIALAVFLYFVFSGKLNSKNSQPVDNISPQPLVNTDTITPGTTTGTTTGTTKSSTTKPITNTTKLVTNTTKLSSTTNIPKPLTGTNRPFRPIGTIGPNPVLDDKTRQIVAPGPMFLY